MKNLVFNQYNIIVDILDEDLDDNSPYFQIHPDCKILNVEKLNYPFQIGQNILYELINLINNSQDSTFNEINLLKERIELIEKILIDEIINSNTFGRYEEKVDVKFQQ